MPFLPFALEEWQSRYEQSVRYNLADSGVQPVLLRELVADPQALDALLATPLHYPYVQGTPRLRRLIADLYPGAGPENVLVTVGASEANAIAVQTLLAPGDTLLTMEPSYRQVWGLAHNLGCRVETFPLRPEDGWAPDLDALAARMDPAPRLLAICNPNNPTGYILSDAEMDRIVEFARAADAWLLADEVYRGAERLTEIETPTFYGRYEKVIALGSMSKAYGLSGLRLGWIVAPADLVEALWRRHEYATIATSALSMPLAELALAPPLRDRLLARTRAYIRDGYRLIAEWVQQAPDRLAVVPPAATALAFVQYHTGEESTHLAERIRQEASVLVAPGSAFGIEGHLRLTHGLDPAALVPALEGISRVLTSRPMAVHSGAGSMAGTERTA